MDYEKKYKEALERAKDYHNDYTQDIMEDIFPELKESEDERIRKDCIKYLNWEYQHCPLDEDKMKIEKLIAWLEKQGDDKVEQKFKIGDWVVYCGKPYQITGLHNDTFTLTSCDGSYFFNNVKSTNEPVFHLWTIQDAKDGDVLCYKDEISLYKHDIKNCTKEETTFGGFIYHCCYDGKRFITDSLYSLTEQDKMDIYPATTEQRNILFLKMKEAGYEWDKEKKELKKIVDEEYNGKDYGIDSLWHAKNILEKTLGKVSGYQSDDGILEHKCAITAVKKLYEQKPAEWSEEDETGLTNTIIMLKEGASLHFNKKDITKAVDFLKSLRPQKQWKPTKEQMDALLFVVQHYTPNVTDKLAWDSIKILELMYYEIKQ